MPGEGENKPIKAGQYQRLIDARNFHYDNLNKWLTFFYVAVGAVFAGYCTLLTECPCSSILPIVLCVGYVIGLAGYLSCKGYYYWEKNWIMLLHKFEKDNMTDQNRRVYSVFADVKGLDKPWSLVGGANVSTTKVALVLTFIITCTFSAILIYDIEPFAKVFYNVIFAIISSALATWFIAWLVAKALPSIEQIDDLKLSNKTNNDKSMKSKDKKTKHYDWLIILLAFIVIIGIMLGVWLGAYRPQFSGEYSSSNIEWGGFGDFFWGLGTMMFTALSVWVLYFVNKQLRENQDKQQKQQVEFQSKIEEERQKLLKEIIRKKRMESWLESYHAIILKLTGPELKSDVVWLNLLREVTIIYKSIVAEQIELPQEIITKINTINDSIKDVITKSYVIKAYSKKMLQLALLNVSLNKNIIDLYFELLNHNKVAFDIDFIFPHNQEEGKEKHEESK